MLLVLVLSDLSTVQMQFTGLQLASRTLVVEIQAVQMPLCCKYTKTGVLKLLSFLFLMGCGNVQWSLIANVDLADLSIHVIIANITDWVQLTFFLFDFHASDLFSLSDFRILRCIRSFGIFDYLYWWPNVICVSVVCQMGIGHWKHYLTVDSWTILLILVYLIIVPNGLFVSESSVSQSHFYLSKIVLILIKLLKRIHMVSLITVLNDNVWQFFILLIYLILAHLVCFTTGLNESLNSCILCLFWFICYVLLPYQMDLSVQTSYFLLSVCSFIFGMLNCSTGELCVQIDNFP